MEMVKIRSAEEVLKKKEETRQQKMKENVELVNKELLEFEKALNKYEKDEKNDSPYIELVGTIIKTDEVKNLLKNNGYIIDRISNDIPVGNTRIWIDKKAYTLAHASQLTDDKQKAYWNLAKSTLKMDDPIIKSSKTYNISKDKENFITEILDKIQELGYDKPIVIGSQEWIDRINKLRRDSNNRELRYL